MFKVPAALVAMELVDDEGRLPRVVSGEFVGKRRQVLFNKRVRRNPFRLVALVPVDWMTPAR